ncbi:RYamide receptor-like [Dendronephthya gigantea]|uniref:RYamide receptor-like n=1 Tax=Dendronephthya gigantea TaxID=151771 RepID=UPI00106AA9ED|nr:RYamide receptor-like [Dendronephthya gigantea]XP_028390607.1 RYamide receptor-like [Dendronephthya gigantea]XP_028390609.1 RYamide receptor-like [Dendronephthya gigantea]XP_028390610.1 RYamide receptor-like [Dendronephthya gigantea]
MDNTSITNSTQIPEKGENVLIIFLDSLILLLSLSGNSLVIYTIQKERKLQTTCNYLLLNLAICDIVVVSLGTSIDIMLQFTKSKWILGSFLCHIISPALTMFYISASLILVVISIDRYKMFVHPLKARYQRKHVKYAVIIVHAISLCCVLPFAYFSTITDGYCYDSWPEIWYRKAYTVFLFLMQYAIPLLIMGFAYVGVAISLLRNKSAFKKKFDSQASTPMKSLVSLASRSQMHDGLTENEHHKTSAVCRPMSDGKERTMSVILENNGRVSSAKSDVNQNNKAGGKRSIERCFRPCRKSRISDEKYLIHNGDKNSNIRPEVKSPTQSETTRERGPSSPDRMQMKRANAIRRRDRTGTVSGTPSKRDQRNNRALKMILLVVVVFALFMLPMQIMSLLLDFGGKPTPEKFEIYAWFVMCSYFGSCTLNPFIYGLVDRTFRAGFKKFAKKLAGVWKCSSN